MLVCNFLGGFITLKAFSKAAATWGPCFRFNRDSQIKPAKYVYYGQEKSKGMIISLQSRVID